jgi:hypothetical protein
MAYTVEAAFNTLHENINLSGDHRDTANKRRDRIVELLKNQFTILEAFSAGSIPKYTALRGHADADGQQNGGQGPLKCATQHEVPLWGTGWMAGKTADRCAFGAKPEDHVREI